MTEEQRKAFEAWADTHMLSKATFGWGLRSTEELTLRNCTYNQALAVAQAAGYSEPCWYKPWSWLNWVVTVG